MKFGQKALVIVGVLALGTALVWTTPAKANPDNDHYAGYLVKTNIRGFMPEGTVSDEFEYGTTFSNCKPRFILVRRRRTVVRSRPIRFSATCAGSARAASPSLPSALRTSSQQAWSRPRSSS